MKANGALPRLVNIILSVLIILTLCVYAFYLVPRIGGGKEEGSYDEDRTYHILVVGEAESEVFLRQIYQGASDVSAAYDCVVELNVPESHARNETLQDLFDYASFTNADGVIAFVGDEDGNVEVPVNLDGTPIPLITLSQYMPGLPQVSYIGTNYSELGRKIAMESRLTLSNGGSLVIINTDKENNPNYSTLMASLTTTLGAWNDMHSTVLDLPSSADISRRNTPLSAMLADGATSLIVCLSTDDSIRSAQLVNDMELAGKVAIIGFGEGSVVEAYLEKGVITKLLSIDSAGIGRTALGELFEYIRYGHANNYMTADVLVRNGGSL